MAGASPHSSHVAPLRRIEKPELGFALSLPDDWREEPPDPFNGGAELARFVGPGPGHRNCLVFRNALQPGVDAPTVARRVVPVLERGGFGNFTHHATTLTGRAAARLDFDKPMPDGIWSVRHFFVVAGDTPFCVSFGTSALEQDAPLIETLAATFTFLGANPDVLPPPPPVLRIDPALQQRVRAYSLHARRVLLAAFEEAVGRRTAIHQEHLLAGISAVPESLGLTILARCGVSQEELQRAVQAILPPQAAPDASTDDPSGAVLRLSEDAERILGCAEDEARTLGTTTIGVEHLVLGLLQVPGPTCDLLAKRGVTIDRARAALPG